MEVDVLKPKKKHCYICCEKERFLNDLTCELCKSNSHVIAHRKSLTQTFYFASGLNYFREAVNSEMVLTRKWIGDITTFIGASHSITTDDEDFKGLIIPLKEGVKITNLRVNVVPKDKIKLDREIMCQISIRTADRVTANLKEYKELLTTYIFLHGDLSISSFSETVNEIKSVGKYLIIVFEADTHSTDPVIYGSVNGSFDIIDM